MEFKIPFRLPGLNEFLRAAKGNKYQAARIKKCVDQDIALFLHGKVERPVHVTFVWLEPNRRRDKDNVAFGKKFILDALQKKGVLPDDGNKWISGFTDEFIYRKGEGVIVTLEPDEIVEARHG
ncbi:RusA family crossover junction endodeoxyribonuclease [Christensenella intestinihominis]|uniref:hypothetical protein n=1 Tax=Christensenella intestinihominis TaxID=1851429 RepID=UPI0008341851|nr:hypothetical protein [Christensenella intestinihominis]